MKYFPFKILILCVLLPPILYIFSVQSIERILHDTYLSEIENLYVGDTNPLFNGSIHLKDAVAKNTTHYLQTKKMLAWGLKANVTVATKHGKIIFPPVFEEERSPQLSEPMKIAAENYTLMNDGLLLELNLTLKPNTRLSYLLLMLYIFMSVITLNMYYRRGLNKVLMEERKKEGEIKRLQTLEKAHFNKLSDLTMEKEVLISEYDLMKTQFEDIKEKTNRNENEMIEEIMALEEKMNQNLARQKQQEDEIEILKEKLTRYEKEKPKLKAPDALQKRFKAIYKNIVIQERALSGFIDLTDNLKIKAEEIIHQLDQDSTLVTVKRKVFGKKGRETVLEIVFAYMGRLYFRRLKDNRIEILAIGTKNVQAKDLEFLDKL